MPVRIAIIVNLLPTTRTRTSYRSPQWEPLRFTFTGISDLCENPLGEGTQNTTMTVPSVAAEEDADGESDPAKLDKKDQEKRRDLEGQPPPIPEKVWGSDDRYSFGLLANLLLIGFQQPKTSYVTFMKDPAPERSLPPPPLPPPFGRSVHGLPDRAASQGRWKTKRLLLQFQPHSPHINVVLVIFQQPLESAEGQIGDSHDDSFVNVVDFEIAYIPRCATQAVVKMTSCRGTTKINAIHWPSCSNSQSEYLKIIIKHWQDTRPALDGLCNKQKKLKLDSVMSLICLGHKLHLSKFPSRSSTWNCDGLLMGHWDFFSCPQDWLCKLDQIIIIYFLTCL